MRTSQPTTTRLCAVFAFGLGALTLVGWIWRIPEIVQMRPDWTPMVVNTGIGFVLAGCGLFAATFEGRRSAWLANVLGALVVLLAMEELAVLVFDIAPAFSLPELHLPLQPGYPHPGRMAPNTALCFLLFGAGLAAILRWRGATAGIWVGRISLAVMAIGLLGVVGYLLQLEYLYGWTGVVRMAVHTGVGMTALGGGLWNLAHLRAGAKTVFDGGEVAAVYRTATLLLLLVATSAGIGGFAFLQSQMTQRLHEDMLQLTLDRVLLFDQILQHRSVRAQVVSDDDEPGPLLRVLESSPDDAAVLQALREWAGGLQRNGFSSISVEASGRQWHLAGVSSKPALTVALQGKFPGRLLWDNGYVLRRALPVHDDAGFVGMLISEQRLTALDMASSASDRSDATGEMAVCMATDAHRMNCFPQRSRKKPFSVDRVIDGLPLPMHRALSGESGTIVALDYLRHRVLAAYAPIGDTGLGLVVKKDIAEIYAPVRRQFQRIVGFLVVLLLAGLWILRRRLRPLLRALEETRSQARAESLRFSAAVESNLDAFFILECIRDQAGVAYDFRYELLNERAERTLRLKRAEVIGRSLCELFPERRTDGMLTSYLRAVETGEPIIEERSALAQDGQTRWYHLQAVKLGDGLGVTVRDVTTARHAANLIRHQALHDPLTGLANRAGFELAISGAIAEAQRRGQVTALALLDLDDFKQVNDSLGHAAGDHLLQEVATRLRECTRPTDTIARLGGDEFVVVLPNITYPQGAEIVARKLVAHIARPLQVDGRDIAVTVSVGISACPRDGLGAAVLLKCADSAMYRAKRAGRNGYALYGEG